MLSKEIPLSRLALNVRFVATTGALAIVLLSGCDPQTDSEPNSTEAQTTAAELEAAADNTTDNTQAEVLENQAKALREASEGDAEGEVKVTGQ